MGKIVIHDKLRRLNYMLSEIDSLYHEAAYKLGISDSAMMILYSICVSGQGCMLSDIYKLSGICRQTVNSALRKLEKEEVLYLEKSGGKTKKVFLTEKGKALSEKTAVRLISAENSILDGWSENDTELYIELNRKYAADFKKQLEKF